MSTTHTARENGWVDYPADVFNEKKPVPLPIENHPFWTRCAEKYGGPILEVACGNGRWLIPLAAHGDGHEAVGVDINRGLIRSAGRLVAKINDAAQDASCPISVDGLDESSAAALRAIVNRLAEAGRTLDVSFHVGDIVNLNLGRKFGLVIMTSWTFPVLLTQEDQIAFLEEVHDHLVPGGAFAFNLFIPFHRHRRVKDRNGVYEFTSAPDDYDKNRRTYDPVTQIETLPVYGQYPIRQRHTNLSELKLLFRLTGFRIVEMYGDDQDLRPITGKEDNDYTILAERT